MVKDTRERINAIRAAVQSVDAELAGGTVPSHDLEAIKQAVDDLRLRLWASMRAAASDDPDSIGKFRVRRALDMCRSLVQDFERGELSVQSAEARQLGESARAFLEALQAPLDRTG